MPCSLFWPNDKKRETRSSCDTGITEKTQQRKAARKDVEIANKVSQSRKNNRSTNSNER